MAGVLRRPIRSATIAVLVLLALAVPALGMRTASPGATDIPASLPIIQTYDRIQQAFPGGAGPAKVVVQARDVTAPKVAAALKTLQSQALSSGQAKAPFTVEVNSSRTVAVASVGLIGNGTDSVSVHALKTIRHDIVPAAFADSGATFVGVTGQTALSVDSNAQLRNALPLVIGFVLALAFLLLLFAFRSLVVPLLAIGLNLLSVAAAYGVLVLVFQHSLGGRDPQLHLDRHDRELAAALPVRAPFRAVDGLPRLHPQPHQGIPRSRPVQRGRDPGGRAGHRRASSPVRLRSWWRCSPSSPRSRRCPSSRPGSASGVAVLVDATIVRTVLLPASMALLGERNWYLPRWLEWLPRTGGENICAGSAAAAAPGGSGSPSPDGRDHLQRMKTGRTRVTQTTRVRH